MVGVNREAIEEAEHLTKFASTVHWITQTDPKADDEHAQALLAEPNVKHWSKTRMLEIEGDNSGVTQIQLKQKSEEADELLKLEGVFICVAGSKPMTEFLEGQDVALKEDGGVVVDDEMQCENVAGELIDGVYAIGDIRNTPYKQVVVAASDGCIAAMSIDKFLKGRKSIKVDWVHQ